MVLKLSGTFIALIFFACTSSQQEQSESLEAEDNLEEVGEELSEQGGEQSELEEFLDSEENLEEQQEPVAVQEVVDSIEDRRKRAVYYLRAKSPVYAEENSESQVIWWLSPGDGVVGELMDSGWLSLGGGGFVPGGESLSKGIVIERQVFQWFSPASSE